MSLRFASAHNLDTRIEPQGDNHQGTRNTKALLRADLSAEASAKADARCYSLVIFVALLFRLFSLRLCGFPCFFPCTRETGRGLERGKKHKRIPSISSTGSWSRDRPAVSAVICSLWRMRICRAIHYIPVSVILSTEKECRRRIATQRRTGVNRPRFVSYEPQQPAIDARSAGDRSSDQARRNFSSASEWRCSPSSTRPQTR